MLKLAEDEALYTPEEASQICNLSIYYLKHLLRMGELKGIKINTRWFVYSSAIFEFLEKREGKGK